MSAIKPNPMTAKPNPMTFLLLVAAAISGLLAPPSAASTDFSIYSDPPTALIPGQSFQYDLTPQGIPYGPTSLHMQYDCDLVAYFLNQKIWATNTSGNGTNCYLTVDSHGEATLRHDLNYPIWSSGKRSDAEGQYTFLQLWNGGLAVYGPTIWSSNYAPEYSVPENPDETTDYAFYSFSVVPIGKILHYNNYMMSLRDNCNLVLHNTNTMEVKWESKTYSESHDCFVTLDQYGELFIKHNRREVLWRSGARSVNPEIPLQLFAFVLKYDGTLAIYGPQIWTSKPFW